MGKPPTWVWILGGGLVLALLVLRGNSSTPVVQTLAPINPDTSAQDAYNAKLLDSKTSIAGQLINVAGTLDVLDKENAGQASHDWYSLQSIEQNFLGQADVLGVQYAGEESLAGIAAKNNVDLANIASTTALGSAQIGATNSENLARIDSGTQTQLAQISAAQQQAQAQAQAQSQAASNASAEKQAHTLAQGQQNAGMWQAIGNFAGAIITHFF